HKRSSCLHGRLDSNGSRTLGRASISFNYTHNEYTLPGVPRKALTRNVVSGKGLSPPHAQKRADHEPDGWNLQAEINRRMDDGNAGHRESRRGQIAVSAPAARCAPEAYDPWNQDHQPGRDGAWNSQLDNGFKRCRMGLVVRLDDLLRLVHRINVSEAAKPPAPPWRLAYRVDGGFPDGDTV